MLDKHLVRSVRPLRHYRAKSQQPPAKAGGLNIGGLNRRLKEKTTKSRWFLPRLPHIRAG